MTTGYLYDVFVSHVVQGGLPTDEHRFEREWTRNLLIPTLREELQSVAEDNLSCFSDRDIPWGVDWPRALSDAHARSRVLLAVLSPGYFREAASWCRWEFGSMLARGRQFNTVLVLGVTFRDGKFFPKAAQELQRLDLQQHTDLPAILGGSVPADFRARVREIATRLSELAADAPEWSPDFPAVLIDPINPRKPIHEALP